MSSCRNSNLIFSQAFPPLLTIPPGMGVGGLACNSEWGLKDCTVCNMGGASGISVILYKSPVCIPGRNPAAHTAMKPRVLPAAGQGPRTLLTISHMDWAGIQESQCTRDSVDCGKVLGTL